MKIEKYHLTLRTLESKDVESLSRLAADPKIWQCYRAPYHEAAYFKREWFDNALHQQARGERLPFVLEWQGDLAGSSSFYEINEKNKRLTIGYTWYALNYWGTNVNPTAKLLLMEYAFETLGVNRVAYCIDEENLRSCRAVEKIGAKKEGVLRRHMIRYDGSLRNSVIYSVIADEWLSIKAALLKRINF